MNTFDQVNTQHLPYEYQIHLLRLRKRLDQEYSHIPNTFYSVCANTYIFRNSQKRKKKRNKIEGTHTSNIIRMYTPINITNAITI